MAQLIVRGLDGEVVRALRVRAARHGRSAEAEHREILRTSLKPGARDKTLKEILLEMPPVGEDADFRRSRDRGRKIAL
ncbi:MAG: FitA-like ribbon-helix-helix domain-containing protein [Thermoplasmata archaeon]